MTEYHLHRRLSADGRAWVKEVWKAAEGLAARLDALGPLTTRVGRKFAERDAAAEQLEGAEVQRAFFVVIKAGYASRTVLAGPTNQPSLALSSLPAVSPLEAGHDDTASADALIDPSATIAFDDFESVMTLPHEMWDAYVALVTRQLQRGLPSGSVTWRELHRDRIERMLRYGYVLRCLDEATGDEPAAR
jgi:hypothetical protein